MHVSLTLSLSGCVNFVSFKWAAGVVALIEQWFGLDGCEKEAINYHLLNEINNADSRHTNDGSLLTSMLESFE